MLSPDFYNGLCLTLLYFPIHAIFLYFHYLYLQLASCNIINLHVHVFMATPFMLQDQKRAEKVSKRVNAIQEVKESVSLLTQLLQDYDSSTNNQSNAELIQVSREMLLITGKVFSVYTMVTVVERKLDIRYLV